MLVSLAEGGCYFRVCAGDVVADIGGDDAIASRGVNDDDAIIMSGAIGVDEPAFSGVLTTAGGPLVFIKEGGWSYSWPVLFIAIFIVVTSVVFFFFFAGGVVGKYIDKGLG